jgi:glyoxylase-like metal-dependent hydrolase (beta-lactamase superfamily II)
MPAPNQRGTAVRILDASRGMIIQHFFDERTSTVSYVVHDPASRVGVVIDPVTDFDPHAGRVTHEACERIGSYVRQNDIDLELVLDTHAHADHMTGMPFFQARHGARSVIGWRIGTVQETFREVFNLGPDFPVDGRQFDLLMHDREVLHVGPLRIEGLFTPGHTPACMTYRIGDALFVGDVLFTPDYGVARCDFPGGSAEGLWDSIQMLYRLPDDTRVFTCHDYRPGGRALRFASTIGEHKRDNVQLSAETRRDDFLLFRRRRDRELAMPALMLASMQVNVRAGRLPHPEANGTSYLKVPLNRF